MDGGSGGPAAAGGGAHPRLRRGGVGADECEEDTCVSYEEEDTRMHAYRRRWVGADECEAVKAIDGWARNALIPDESFFQVTKR
jgi:hypothetical protein